MRRNRTVREVHTSVCPGARRVLPGFALLMGLWSIGLPYGVHGQNRSATDPVRFVEWIGQDIQALGRGVWSRHALYTAAGLSVLVVSLAPFDSTLTEGAVTLAEGTPATLRRAANELGNVDAVRPMALALFLGSLLSKNATFQDASYTSLEAIVIANLLTNVLKGVVGRARPFENEGAWTFVPLSGNTSFPSGHATTVFAFTTPWLLYYPNYRTAAIFLMGAGTAFIRMADRLHWFSDVLTGSAIGFTTGLWLTRRHQRGRNRASLTPVVSAAQPGVALRLTF